MAHHRRVVLENRVPSDRIPEWATSGVLLIEWLERQGTWSEMTDRARIQREGGYAGIDAVLFLLYFFMAEAPGGLKEFSSRARRYHQQLAAVAGRQRLPTQSSISRILGAADADWVQEFGNWLLREAPSTRELLRHPAVRTRDAQGESWHMFDWDPTVTTLRHRALPTVDGPDGRRRSKALAASGYCGRKRGDVQFSRGTLQHAGSGVGMAPGNGLGRVGFEIAVQQVVDTCASADLPLDRAIVRVDGVGGNVPFITTAVEAGVRYVTRVAHYQLLQSADAVAHLDQADWHEVPSSGSGPTRYATDLGHVTLEPAASSVRATGEPFEPIETRVVVSCFRSSIDGRGAGVVVAGRQYELYATDLPADGWPAAEIVASYYGRTGQENRFQQEDRELGLDRIFSYHLPGQQLATVVGLFVWNWQTCRGMELEELSDEMLPPQEPATRKAGPPIRLGDAPAIEVPTQIEERDDDEPADVDTAAQSAAAPA